MDNGEPLQIRCGNGSDPASHAVDVVLAAGGAGAFKPGLTVPPLPAGDTIHLAHAVAPGVNLVVTAGEQESVSGHRGFTTVATGH